MSAQGASESVERAVNAVDTQRDAILSAIAEHRAATLSAVRDGARAKAATPHAPAGADRALVLANIVGAIKALIAEEVRAQILALLDVASRREQEKTTPPKA